MIAALQSSPNGGESRFLQRQSRLGIFRRNYDEGDTLCKLSGGKRGTGLVDDYAFSCLRF